MLYTPNVDSRTFVDGRSILLGSGPAQILIEVPTEPATTRGFLTNLSFSGFCEEDVQRLGFILRAFNNEILGIYYAPLDNTGTLNLNLEFQTPLNFLRNLTIQPVATDAVFNVEIVASGYHVIQS